MEKKKPLEGLGKIARALIKVGLPVAATAIGGPAGGAIAGAIGGLLKTDPTDSDALSVAIEGADPETVVRIHEVVASIELARIDYAKSNDEQVTARWGIDKESGYWLPSNIRPMTLVWALLFWSAWNFLSLVVAIVFFLKFGDLNEGLMDFINMISLQAVGYASSVTVAYFGLRTVDKGNAAKAARQQ